MSIKFVDLGRQIYKDFSCFCFYRPGDMIIKLNDEQGVFSRWSEVEGVYENWKGYVNIPIDTLKKLCPSWAFIGDPIVFGERVKWSGRYLPKIVEEVENGVEYSGNYDSHGVEMAVTQGGGIPSWLQGMEGLSGAVKEISETMGMRVKGVMINRLKPGVAVPFHTDAQVIKPDVVGGRIYRFHLPIITNINSFWEDKLTGVVNRMVMKAGHWYGPMPVWAEHRVGNMGDSDRIHLVVDLH